MKTDTAEDTKLRQLERVGHIIRENGHNSEKLIPILHEIQKEYRYLPEEALLYTANALDISPARVFGVATFYTHFTLTPKGKYLIKVCDGTACHVRGSSKLIESIRSVLEMEQDQFTTGDFLFTLETVSCLGACGLAPVMVINDEVYGQMTPEKAEKVLTELKMQEKGE